MMFSFNVTADAMTDAPTTSSSSAAAKPAWRSATSSPSKGRQFTILEAADAPAAAWRERWDSLKLFTPVRYDSLPGRAFPGDPDSYPGRDDVVAYLTDYARDFELPRRAQQPRPRRPPRRPRLPGRARRPQPTKPTRSSSPPARSRSRACPPIADPLDPRRSSSSTAPPTARPDHVPAGPVLVAGGGNTGFQIAEELVAHPRGAPVDRLAPDTAAAAHRRPRPVPLPRSDRAHARDRRLAARPAPAVPRRR